MMRRQPTLIPLTDVDVQDVRAFLDARKNGVAPPSMVAPSGGVLAQKKGANPEMVINDFALEAEIAQAAAHLASGS